MYQTRDLLVLVKSIQMIHTNFNLLSIENNGEEVGNKQILLLFSFSHFFSPKHQSSLSHVFFSFPVTQSNTKIALLAIFYLTKHKRLIQEVEVQNLGTYLQKLVKWVFNARILFNY